MASSYSVKNFVIREKCPVCDGKNLNELYSNYFNESPVKDYLINFYSEQGGVELDYLNHEKYQVVECTDCSLVFQKVILGEFLMDKLYNEWINPEWIKKNTESSYNLNYYSVYSNNIFKVINVLNKKPNELVFLDFGMGWGNWCKMSSAFGIKTFGIEISEERINNAAKHGIKNLKMEDLDEEQFDFINTDQVFEHIANPFEVISVLSKSLKKNGIMRICVPDGNSIKSKLNKMDWSADKNHPNSLNVIAPLEHINCFTTESIVVMAERVGLQWLYIPAFPMQTTVSNELSISQKIQLATRLPLDLIKLIGRKIKKSIGLTYNPKPDGTNLFFQKI